MTRTRTGAPAGGREAKWPAKPVERPFRVGFFLPPDFILMSFAAAIEPLRAANNVSEKPLYEWKFVTIGGRPAEALGGQFQADAAVGDDITVDLLVVCSPSDWTTFRDDKTFAWLRQIARKGVMIASVSAAVFVLARAGLLKGRKCAVHWNYDTAFLEEFPDHSVSRSIFVFDGNRVTCGGGLSALDMMHSMIKAQHGHELATTVSEWFLHTRVRREEEPQRMSLQYRTGISNRSVLEALSQMESHLEEPLSVEYLAARCGKSVRQLERLFRAHVGTSIVAVYRGLRLDRSKHLLQQTSLSITEIAMSAGFSTVAHFSDAYRVRFGYPPSRERERFAQADRGRP